MKKTAIVVAVALAGLTIVAQAAPKDNTWYIDAKPGWFQYRDTGFISDNGPTHEDRLGAGALGGYQVNPHVGFEMGYDWLGRAPCKDSVENGAYKAQGVQLTVRLGYPVTSDLDVYARLSGMVWCADTKSNFNGKNHDTGVSPAFAGGVEYAITPEIATRLEYQWISNVGDAHTIGTCPDSGMLSLGVSYRFGQDEAAPVVAPAPTPAPEVQTKHFTLKSDVLFIFNKATLKPEGQTALNQLYSQLSSLDPKDGSVAVLDYTDRIGSNACNQALSEHHVQPVADYLISKDIPVDKVSARGMGESSPIIGNTCDNVKRRAALIDCLAPNRRMKIEVEGIEDVITQPQA